MIKIALPSESANSVRSSQRTDRSAEDSNAFVFAEVLDKVLPEGSENFAKEEFTDPTDTSMGVELDHSHEAVVEQQVLSASLQTSPILLAPFPQSVTFNQLALDRSNPSEAMRCLSNQISDSERSPQTQRFLAELSVPRDDHKTILMFPNDRSERPAYHLVVSDENQERYPSEALRSAVSDGTRDPCSHFPRGDKHDIAPKNVAESRSAVITPSIDAPIAKQLLSLLEAPVKALPPMIVSDVRKEVPEGIAIKALRMTLRPESLGEVEVTIRRSGNEVRVHIQLSRQAAADELRDGLDQLNSRLGGLLPREMSPQITVSVREPEVGLGPALNHTFTRLSGDGVQGGGHGGILSGNGERSSPHKDESRSRLPKSNRHESDTPLQRDISGIVI